MLEISSVKVVLDGEFFVSSYFFPNSIDICDHCSVLDLCFEYWVFIDDSLPVNFSDEHTFALSESSRHKVYSPFIDHFELSNGCLFKSEHVIPLSVDLVSNFELSFMKVHNLLNFIKLVIYLFHSFKPEGRKALEYLNHEVLIIVICKVVKCIFLDSVPPLEVKMAPIIMNKVLKQEISVNLPLHHVW